MKITAQGYAVVEYDSHIGRWVQESGKLCHDLMVKDRIVPLIPDSGVVLDVGANIGDHTIEYAKKVGAFGRVIAIEPHPEAAACLRFNMVPYPWVQVMQVAIASLSGDWGQVLQARRFLARDDGNLGASHLSSEAGIPVECMAIDDLGLSICDLIKLDIEGMEFHALSGAAETISHCKPIIVSEVCPGHLARYGATPDLLFGLLKTYGYTWERLSDDSVQYDIIAKPK